MRTKSNYPAVTSLLLLWAMGCASGPSAALEDGLIRRRSSVDLALLQRPTPGFVQLSLWLDAGSLDAEPPQVATMAAWVAATAAGPAVAAQVWPDAIELRLECEPSAISKCARALAKGLSTRRVGEEAVARARRRLARDRRNAVAADPRRLADELALQALLGKAALGLFPLGEAARDREIGVAAVERFLARHFGTQRALLVAAGDVDEDIIASASSEAFANVPRASHSRATRTWELRDQGEVVVELDNVEAVSAALAATDQGQASAAALAVLDALRQEGLRLETRAYAFAVRGLNLALVRATGGVQERVLRTLGRQLQLLREEGVPGAAAASPDESLLELSRSTGLRWATGPASSDTLAFGVGVLGRGGRGDELAARDPDALGREALRQQLQGALQAGQATARPEFEGELDERQASLTLANGAHLSLRRHAAERVVIVLRFASPPAKEPAVLHGRAALLASLVTCACPDLPPPALETRLRALGASLLPQVDAESWGLSLTLPRESWRDGLELALSCALYPRFRRPLVAAARFRLQEQLDENDDNLAHAAYLVAAQQPGAIAPRGHRDRLANVTPGDLAELWLGAAHGQNVSMAIVGDLDIEQAAWRAARRLSILDHDVADARAGQPRQAELAGPVQPTERYHEAIVVWHSPARQSNASGARAFAAWMRASLQVLPQLEVSWHAAGASAIVGGWAALRVAGPPTQLNRLGEHLSALTGGEFPRELARAAARADRQQTSREAQRAGTSMGIAQQMATAPFRAATPAKAEPAHDTARRLWATQAAWRPLR